MMSDLKRLEPDCSIVSCVPSVEEMVPPSISPPVNSQFDPACERTRLLPALLMTAPSFMLQDTFLETICWSWLVVVGAPSNANPPLMSNVPRFADMVAKETVAL